MDAQKLKGFRDYLPEQARLRRQIINTLYNEATLAGFLPIDTPALEYSETLLGQGGEETDKEVYSFEDHGGRKVALRFDLTVPFARFVAENLNELPLPFKKVQAGEVWRGEKPQKGRYRQFCQADVDIVGADSIEADVEVIGLLAGTMARVLAEPRLNISTEKQQFIMSVGHRHLLGALIKKTLPNVADNNEHRVLIALDKLTKIGREKVATLLQEIPGADAAGATTLLDYLLTKDATGASDLEALRAMLPESAQPMLKRFAETIELLRRQFKAFPAANIVADLSIARGLGYYTGVVFETFLTALPGFGSISSGGRYNDLVARFIKQDLPSVGGSIGVDRLLAGIEQLQAPSAQREHGVFIAMATEDAREYAFAMLRELRDQGIMTDIAVKTGKLGNQFKFADKRGYQGVITVGTDEVNQKTFSLKNLATGQEEKNAARADLVKKVRGIFA